MEYTPPQGLLYHRQTGAKWVKQFGINTTENNIIVTTGAQHAINCVLSACFEYGDRIAVDYLTYPGIKTAAKRCGIRLEGVLMDGEGMIPEELEALCKRHAIKGIYTSCCMQNPTNATMSDERKNKILKIIKNENLLLIEDDLYHFLCTNIVLPLSSFIPDQSIYISGLAKAFYAGLRIGFVVSPAKYYNKICQAIVDSVWMAPALNAEIACECINRGIAMEIINSKRYELIKRAAIMHNKLKNYVYKYVADNMFAWLRLPDDWSSAEFEKAAQKKGIHIVASDKFTVSNIELPNYIRISLSGAKSLNEFEQGIDILVKTMRHEYDEVVGIL